MNRVLPELFGQRDEEVFEQLREPERRAVLSERAGGDGGTRCSRRPGWPSRCGAPGSAHLQRSRPGSPGDVPVLLLPYLFTPRYGAAHDPAGGDALAEELGL